MSTIHALSKDKKVLEEINQAEYVDIYLLKEPFGKRDHNNILSSEVILMTDSHSAFHISINEHDFSDPINELYSLNFAIGIPKVELIYGSTLNVELSNEKSLPMSLLKLYKTIHFKKGTNNIELYKERQLIKDRNGHLIAETVEENKLLLLGRDENIYISCSEVIFELTISDDPSYIKNNMLECEKVTNFYS